jgi:hypothetical protein
MRKVITNEIRISIAIKAKYKCEYCLLPEKVSFYNFQIDHIISIKHGGTNDIAN